MNNLKLKGIIVEQGLKCKDVAASIGISDNTFARKLHGKGSFSMKEAKQLCEILGITDNETKCEIFLS